MSSVPISTDTAEFSHRTRAAALARFGASGDEGQFDLLVIGGGITGAAVARDAALRGLKVALVERKDFAWGTSSRSSKLIHGGLRYLENMEFKLVFEALAERALLLKTVPHMVRPLPFYLPVYDTDKKGRAILGLGLWLYDLLTLFRTPGFHKSLSRDRFMAEIPFVRKEGLTGGFRYYDASMWDDVLAVETLRSAHQAGATIASYVEAVGPLWNRDQVSGFRVRDTEAPGSALVDLRASRVVVCAGPWTDELGTAISSEWKPWLNPSKGVHLIFDLKRIPVPGAMVMTHPLDGRISFVIPRPDFGAGVVIVGTTDGPVVKPGTSPKADVASAAAIDADDVKYLMDLLHRYFPDLSLTHDDILSGYVGVRPLMKDVAPDGTGQGKSLQKVSREHHIGRGPGGTVLVAGGKYTTHRKMAEEIVDFAVDAWHEDVRRDRGAPSLPPLRPANTKEPVNPRATPAAIAQAKLELAGRGGQLPDELFQRYGAEALELAAEGPSSGEDPPGFPLLEAQLVHGIRHQMVVHLEDFYLRRIPLYASRADHGMPWAERLAKVWAAERGLPADAIAPELERLRAELARRSAWKDELSRS